MLTVGKVCTMILGQLGWKLGFWGVFGVIQNIFLHIFSLPFHNI